MASKYDGLARIIIQNIGGKSNVNSLTHCITRLRFKLKDESKANTDLLKTTDGIVTVMQSAGQYQIVIGNHVPQVYEAVCAIGGFSGTGSQDDSSNANMGIGAKLIDTISGIFQPILGVLSAVGILKGILALLAFFELLPEASPTYALLWSIADGFFYFLPMILAYTAAEKFRCNKFITMALAASLLYPAMVGLSSGEVLGTIFAGSAFETNYYSTFLGIPVLLPASGYPSTVLPIIIASFFSAKIEKFWKKVIPDVIKTFFVPLLTLVIVGPLTYLLIGPVMTFISSLLSLGFTNLYAFNTIIAGLIVGAVWQVLVIFGLHWSLIPLALVQLSTNGSSNVLTPMFATTFAQSAVVLAIIIKTKDRKLRDIAIPAFISGIFGVTEAAIYGVTLPKKKPFVISCIGAAVGGAVISAAGVYSYMMGGLGIFGLPSYINPQTKDISGMVWAFISLVVGFGISFVLTMATYKDDAPAEAAAPSAPAKTSVGGITEHKVKSPLKGKVMPLSDVKDEAFASGVMGQGAAIDPSEGVVRAPIDGDVTAFFPTGHAIGLVSADGLEVLIHIGLDTVNLEGKHFTPKVKQGDKVKQGQILLEFDIEAIKKAGYSVVTPVIITNTANYADVIPADDGAINAGDNLITII